MQHAEAATVPRLSESSTTVVPSKAGVCLAPACFRGRTGRTAVGSLGDQPFPLGLGLGLGLMEPRGPTFSEEGGGVLAEVRCAAGGAVCGRT